MKKSILAFAVAATMGMAPAFGQLSTQGTMGTFEGVRVASGQIISNLPQLSGLTLTGLAASATGVFTIMLDSAGNAQIVNQECEDPELEFPDCDPGTDPTTTTTVTATTPVTVTVTGTTTVTTTVTVTSN
ncbi:MULTISPECIES: hypothetical protein [Gammaproteobacteria]|uniref:hypothetical protein n=1 Tax=Gammaproteobacteria TaxID=1236 RepID=UPI000DD035AF|nr:MULTISPECIES: hypothetical protein [Gammaproteobacteria]RTE86045.1 hypothetical protein DQX04_05595 [Aliidiomarina sp. B3213]TCZ91399.1 hypothetical protein EYQ95_05605 [Lysobacter sp. N42]